MKLSPGSLKSIAAGIGLFLWVTAIITVYFLIHKPWGAVLNLGIFMAALDLCLALALISLAGGLGRRLMGAMAEVSALERVLLRAAVGTGVLATGALVIGMLNLLYPWLAWAALGIGLVVLGRDALDWLKDLRVLVDSSLPLTGISRWAKWFVILVVSLNLLRALAPPLKWDTLVYHLEIPKQYVKAGGVFFLAENMYAGFPQVSEILFTWAMALRSGTTAATFGWAVGVVAMIGADGYARRLFGQRAAWLAPAILLTGISTSQAMHWAYIELWVLLFGLAVFISLDYYKVAGRRFWLILAGSAAGFAIGAKYTSGMLLFFGAIVLLPIWDWLALRDQSTSETEEKFQTLAPSPTPISKTGLRNLLLDWLILAGVAALMVLPWLFKNLLLTGNPFYPILFTGDQLDPWAQTFQSGLAPSRTLIEDLLLPIDVTLFGIESAIVIGKPEYSASIGPLLLALIPGIFLGWQGFQRSQKYFLRRLLGVAVSTWVVWGIVSHFADELSRSRHYYGAFGVLAVLATGGLLAASSIKLPQIRVGRVLNAIVALALVLAALTEIISFIYADPLPVLAGQQSQDEYLEQELGSYAMAIEAVNELQPDSLVLFLLEPRTYYCETPCLLDGKLDNWWYLRRARGDAAAIAETLHERGVTHVLIYEAGLEMLQTMPLEYSEADWAEMARFKETQLVPLVDILGHYSLYKLQSVSR